MIHQISITGVTGTPPYSISVCDSTYTYCYLVTGSTTIPPTFTFDVPAPLDGVNNLIVKIIDSTGCEYFEPYSCPPTPTPTPTITPTPTPTPTDLCYCITVVNSGMTDGTFDYIDCNSVLQENVIVSSGIIYYVCGWNPTNVVNLNVSVGLYCLGGSCPPPTPTPTPTPTATPTPTPTSSSTCFSYLLSAGSFGSATFTFTGCCGEPLISPLIVPQGSGLSVCSSTIPVFVSGDPAFTPVLLSGACPIC